MDFTERMLERNRSRYVKPETKEGTSQTSVPLKEVHHNTVTTTTFASTSVDIKKDYPGGNKVTIETTVTMRKLPKRTSQPTKEDLGNDDETTCTEGESESTEEKENDTSQDSQCPLRQDTKSRLKRLGVLYSDDPTRLTSPIHRTEERFLIEEKGPEENSYKSAARSARNARFAALAETINQREDDMKHHPVGGEAQGFARSESSQRLTYKYDNGGKVTTSTNISSVPVDVAHSQLPSRKSPSPVKVVSPDKAKSPVKAMSPVKGRYGSPIQMGTTVAKPTDKVGAQTVEDNGPAPLMGVKQLRSPRKASAVATSGSVLDRAQRYVESTSPTKRPCDPAELPLAERLALFERNAGTAVLPKAPFGMAVPVKKLQPVDRPRPPHQVESHSRQLYQQPPHQTTASTSSLHNRLTAFEKGADNAGKDHMKGILSERLKEMEMLKRRWDRFKGTSEPTPQDLLPSAPPPSPPPPPPMPSPPQSFDYGNQKDSDYSYEEEDDEMYYNEEKVEHKSPPKQKSPELAYPVLKDAKKIKFSPPKPGCLYPCLSDIEVDSSVPESEVENNRSSSSETSNESDINSLGQQIVRLSRTNIKREWLESDLGNERNASDEMDDFLNEALDDSSDEATPPKRSLQSNNVGTVQSRSFEYTRSGEDLVEQHPLLHTVSFYRKQQNMTLKPPSPTRHVYLEPSTDSSDESIDRLEEELDRELKLVEQKINMLQEEVKKQQTYISQASQALNLCCSTIEFSGSIEQLEAEKLLLLASQRRQAALHEIQRLRVEQTIRPKGPANKTLTERGSLIVSQITVPLKMDTVHQAAKDDQCYYLVCLVHCDERVLCTDLLCAPRSLHHHNKLTFPNTFKLEGLYSDFKVTIEVYTVTARNSELIPHDVKYHINTNKKDASKLKLTPRKGKGESRLMMPSVQSPGGPMSVRTSGFSMAGYVIFSLREIHRTQFTLNKNAYTSVLEGSMQLKIETEMSMDVEYRGFLTMFEDVSGFGAWHRRWCLLKGDKLSYWKYPDDECKKFPLDTIELTVCKTQEVDVVPRDVCARPNTFLLETTRPARDTDVDSLVLVRDRSITTIRHLLSADTKDERILWCQHLNKALALMRAWRVTK